MPKVSRSKTKKEETPLRLRKSAVPEKQVSEQITADGEEVVATPVQNYELAKKDYKKKLRHEAWLEKLDNAYAIKKKQKQKQDRKKNKQVDLSEFSDILNMFDIKPKSEVASKATHSKKLNKQQEKVTAIPTNKIKSKKAKKQSEMQEILRMQKVMQHGAFKQNPLATIHQHVQNTFQ